MKGEVYASIRYQAFGPVSLHHIDQTVNRSRIRYSRPRSRAIERLIN